MGLMQMAHDSDPAQEILNNVQGYIDTVHLTGAQVLIGIYVRPAKTASGIMLPDNYRDEDIYQGKAGLILKMGPSAFDDKDEDFFGERKPKVGDWVLYRPSDGFPLDFGKKQKCRILGDRRQVKMILQSPDCVW